MALPHTDFTKRPMAKGKTIVQFVIKRGCSPAGKLRKKIKEHSRTPVARKVHGGHYGRWTPNSRTGESRRGKTSES